MNINSDPARYFDEESQWSHEHGRRDFGSEILESMTYAEGKDILASLMESRIDKKKAFDKEYRRITRIANNYYAPDTFEHDFLIDALWVMTDMRNDKGNYDQLSVLEKYWLFNEARKPTKETRHHSKEDFKGLIVSAKLVEIESLCINRCKRSGAHRLTCLCPFHEEKSPSFTVFIDTNTFYCFGCGVYGDAISYYQKLFGVSFVEAVKRLTGRSV